VRASENGGRIANPVSCPPRLLDLEAAAAYLGGVSPWTIRDLIANGTLKRVRVPLPNGGELRRVLLDREDLDELVRTWKT
jgi:excisionase family DNA binding protein